MKCEIFLGRQPIIDRSGGVVAHELLFRNGLANAATISDGFACTSAVVERTIGSMGIDAVLGFTDGFVNCTADFLYSDLLDILPASRFVLEILEDTDLTENLAARCDVLRRTGFKIALDDVRQITPELLDFLPHVDIVKLDWPYLKVHEIATITSVCKNAGRLILAEKIERWEEHKTAMQMGCDLFQGYYFAKPSVLSASRRSASFSGVMRVLQLLMADASDLEIERALKKAPALIVQLLRLANSSAHPHAHSGVTSIKGAITAVGQRQMMRWCCLLLYGDSTGLVRENDPLVQLVERRSGFMEKAAIKLRPTDSQFSQSACLLGLLSLAYVAQGTDVGSFAADLPVAVSIQSALVNYEGDLGILLHIVESLEEGNFTGAIEHSAVLGRDFSELLTEL